MKPSGLRFHEILRALEDPSERRFALAELNDLLHGLGAAELVRAVAAADLERVGLEDANRVAAMVEQACAARGMAPPAWTVGVPPLEAPVFASELRSLRLHLLKVSPVPFRRRNLFVDAAVGGCV